MAAVTAQVEPPPARRLDRHAGPEPRAWQQEALDAWLAAGRRGVVEAVTGTGKTAVGIIAAADAVARGRRVAVVVPGIDLLDQWYAKLTSDLPSGCDGLLIADEVHHCGAPRFSQAHEEAFEERLGLTDTYERSAETTDMRRGPSVRTPAYTHLTRE